MTNAEIHIFKGDPTKGHDGWCCVVTVGKLRIESPLMAKTVRGAALLGAAILEEIPDADIDENS